MKLYTDMSFPALGDTRENFAPVREVKVVAYDGVYVTALIDGLVADINPTYLYTTYGRFAEVPQVSRLTLEELPDEYDPDDWVEEPMTIEALDGVISQIISDFLYYDRKGDEDVPLDSIQSAIADGTLTVKEIVTRFEQHLKSGLEHGV